MHRNITAGESIKQEDTMEKLHRLCGVTSARTRTGNRGPRPARTGHTSCCIA